MPEEQFEDYQDNDDQSDLGWDECPFIISKQLTYPID